MPKLRKKAIDSNNKADELINQTKPMKARIGRPKKIDSVQIDNKVKKSKINLNTDKILTRRTRKNNENEVKKNLQISSSEDDNNSQSPANSDNDELIKIIEIVDDSSNSKTDNTENEEDIKEYDLLMVEDDDDDDEEEEEDDDYLVIEEVVDNDNIEIIDSIEQVLDDSHAQIFNSMSDYENASKNCILTEPELPSTSYENVRKLRSKDLTHSKFNVNDSNLSNKLDSETENDSPIKSTRRSYKKSDESTTNIEIRKNKSDTIQESKNIINLINAAHPPTDLIRTTRSKSENQKSDSNLIIQKLDAFNEKFKNALDSKKNIENSTVNIEKIEQNTNHIVIETTNLRNITKQIRNKTIKIPLDKPSTSNESVLKQAEISPIKQNQNISPVVEQKVEIKIEPRARRTATRNFKYPDSEYIVDIRKERKEQDNHDKTFSIKNPRKRLTIDKIENKVQISEQHVNISDSKSKVNDDEIIKNLEPSNNQNSDKSRTRNSKANELEIKDQNINQKSNKIEDQNPMADKLRTRHSKANELEIKDQNITTPKENTEIIVPTIVKNLDTSIVESTSEKIRTRFSKGNDFEVKEVKLDKTQESANIISLKPSLKLRSGNQRISQISKLDDSTDNIKNVEVNQITSTEEKSCKKQDSDKSIEFLNSTKEEQTIPQKTIPITYTESKKEDSNVDNKRKSLRNYKNDKSIEKSNVNQVNEEINSLEKLKDKKDSIESNEISLVQPDKNSESNEKRMTRSLKSNVIKKENDLECVPIQKTSNDFDKEKENSNSICEITKIDDKPQDTGNVTNVKINKKKKQSIDVIETTIDNLDKLPNNISDVKISPKIVSPNIIAPRKTRNSIRLSLNERNIKEDDILENIIKPGNYNRFKDIRKTLPNEVQISPLPIDQTNIINDATSPIKTQVTTDFIIPITTPTPKKQNEQNFVEKNSIEIDLNVKIDKRCKKYRAYKQSIIDKEESVISTALVQNTIPSEPSNSSTTMITLENPEINSTVIEEKEKSNDKSTNETITEETQLRPTQQVEINIDKTISVKPSECTTTICEKIDIIKAADSTTNDNEILKLDEKIKSPIDEIKNEEENSAEKSNSIIVPITKEEIKPESDIKMEVQNISVVSTRTRKSRFNPIEEHRKLQNVEMIVPPAPMVTETIPSENLITKEIKSDLDSPLPKDEVQQMLDIEMIAHNVKSKSIEIETKIESMDISEEIKMNKSKEIETNVENMETSEEIKMNNLINIEMSNTSSLTDNLKIPLNLPIEKIETHENLESDINSKNPDNPENQRKSTNIYADAFSGLSNEAKNQIFAALMNSNELIKCKPEKLSKSDEKSLRKLKKSAKSKEKHRDKSYKHKEKMKKQNAEQDENAEIRRSNRIKTISETQKRSHGHGLVKQKSDQAYLENLSERIRSCWPNFMEESLKDFSKVLEELKQPHKKEEDEIEMEKRLSQFSTIRDNIYHCERNISKEAKKMSCDCFLTKEEIERGEFGCGEDCLNRLLMIECGPKCVVGERCTNKRFQKNQYANCKVFRTEKKGFGIMAAGIIEPGEFIMEYVGEVLNGDQFEKRADEYSKDKNKHYYFMALRSDAVIDATSKGNISRFINHSCDPNAETQKWTVNGELRIGFFSTRLIMKDEEITFDYQFQRYGKEAQRCYCESVNCRGWIGEEPDSDGEYVDEDDEQQSQERTIDKIEEITPKITTEIPTKPVTIDPLDKTDQENKLPIQENDKSENEVNEKTIIEPPKKIERPKKVRSEIFDDSDIDIEIEILRRTGLKNQAHTLKLNRLMVRAKSMKARVHLLNLLENGEMPCRRLFLDYHGLRLLYGWMCDCDTNESLSNFKLQLEIVKTLQSLPIPNKTMLKDIKVFNLVKNWASDKKTNVESPNDDTPSDSGSGTPQQQPDSSSSNSPKQQVPENNKTVTDNEISVIKKSITMISTKLINDWETLPEVFRIPKKERIEQMKEHEREADLRYKALGLGNDEPEPSKIDRYRERIRLKHNEKTKSKTVDAWSRDPSNQHLKQLDKYQRRQIFEMKFAQEQQEKKKIELLRLHELTCRHFGLNPRQTSIDDVPAMVNPATGQWYTKDHRLTKTPPSHAHIKPHEQVMSTNVNDYILPEIKLPPFWKYAISPKGKIYYYHTKIRIPQWEPPIFLAPLAVTEETRLDKEIGETSTNIQDCELDSSSDSSDSSEDELSDKLSTLQQSLLLKGYNIPKIEITDEELDKFISERNEKLKNIQDSDTLTCIDTGKTMFSKKKKNKQREGLVQERIISPRTEEDRIYGQQQSRLYRETKEKLRKRKEELRKRKLFFESDPTGKKIIKLTEGLPRAISPYDSEESDDESKMFMEIERKSKIDILTEPDSTVDMVESLISSSMSDNDSRLLADIRELSKDKPTKQNVYEEWKKQQAKLKNEARKRELSKSDHKGGSSAKKKKVSDQPVCELTQEEAKRIKEKFRTDIAGVIVQHLSPYRKTTCKIGRIVGDSDFKHLARKLTHFVMLKELKHCDNTVNILEVTDSVKIKSREFIKKYMSKYGSIYKRHENEPDFKD